MPQLTLYHFQGCPYCTKVSDYLKRRKISVPMKDTHETPGYHDELIKVGGKSQVPCLLIDGKALYESDDIIKWFETNWR